GWYSDAAWRERWVCWLRYHRNIFAPKPTQPVRTASRPGGPQNHPSAGEFRPRCAKVRLDRRRRNKWPTATAQFGLVLVRKKGTYLKESCRYPCLLERKASQ